MPLDKMVLIIVSVIAAAGATIWLAAIVLASSQTPLLGWAVLISIALAAYVVFKVIADRLTNKEDDHYDNIEK
jgi:membrane protein implicated in regulation of membrane protease activity